MPKIDFPLAVFANEALANGQLPLWNDRLGLGYPLYAEGQVAAFYPPSWLVFRLAPITALDVYRVIHLAFAGLGAGLLVLRLRGSRPGAVIAVLVAVLGGGIVAKLEWHNLVAAYAWLPWILLPLVRRPRPTRAGLVASGILFGVQALAGHPNTWLLTWITVSVVLMAGRDGLGGRRAPGDRHRPAWGGHRSGPSWYRPPCSRPCRSAARPCRPMTCSLRPRRRSMSWHSASRAPSRGSRVVPPGTSTPTGTRMARSLSLRSRHTSACPLLGLAVGASRLRRARPLVLAMVALGIAIPVVEALRPEILLSVPLLNGLRSPVRAYLPAALLIGVLAGHGGRASSDARHATPVPVTIGVGVPGRRPTSLVLGVAALAPGSPRRCRARIHFVRECRGRRCEARPCAHRGAAGPVATPGRARGWCRHRAARRGRRSEPQGPIGGRRHLSRSGWSRSRCSCLDLRPMAALQSSHSPARKPNSYAPCSRPEPAPDADDQPAWLVRRACPTSQRPRTSRTCACSRRSTCRQSRAFTAAAA